MHTQIQRNCICFEHFTPIPLRSLHLPPPTPPYKPQPTPQPPIPRPMSRPPIPLYLRPTHVDTQPQYISHTNHSATSPAPRASTNPSQSALPNSTSILSYNTSDGHYPARRPDRPDRDSRKCLRYTDGDRTECTCERLSAEWVVWDPFYPPTSRASSLVLVVRTFFAFSAASSAVAI